PDKNNNNHQKNAPFTSIALRSYNAHHRGNPGQAKLFPSQINLIVPTKSDPKAAYFRDVYDLFLCSILAIAIHQVAVVRNMIAEQAAETFDIITPVPVHFTSHTKPCHHLCASLRHAVPCSITCQVIKGTRCICHDEYVNFFFKCRQRREGDTYFSLHASNDQLFFARGFYR